MDGKYNEPITMPGRETLTIHAFPSLLIIISFLDLSAQDYLNTEGEPDLNQGDKEMRK